MPRWVRRSESKVPLTVEGRAASSTDSGTWSSYSAARRSRAGAGLGFVLNGDGVVCIDLDDCLDGDRVAPWAQDILDKLPPTWIEVSPSRRGLHVWGLADFKGGRKLRDGSRKIEIYGGMRYFAITAVTFGDAPKWLADISGAIASIV
jgi:primase-polymerase (primpol)-like protein